MEKSIPQEQIRLSNLESTWNILSKCAMNCLLYGFREITANRKAANVVFPEGVAYDQEKDDYRTQRTNSVFQLIASLSFQFFS